MIIINALASNQTLLSFPDKGFYRGKSLTGTPGK
jgi:hypothetical protein